MLKFPTYRKGRSDERRSQTLEEGVVVVQRVSPWPLVAIGAVLLMVALISGRDQIWAAATAATAYATQLGKTAPNAAVQPMQEAAKPQYKVITEVKGLRNTTLKILDEPIPADCYPEQHADYDGDAVMWGLGNKVRSAAECCRLCKDFHSKHGGQAMCNIWVWCGDPSGVCWTMDIHTHTTGDCWLKYQKGWDNVTDLAKSNLKVNHRGKFSAEFRKEHKTAPEAIPWVAGLVKP